MLVSLTLTLVSEMIFFITLLPIVQTIILSLENT